MHKTMTEASLYDAALPHKLARINVDTATAFHDIVLDAIAVQEPQESRAAEIKIVEDKKMAMKSESVMYRTIVMGHPQRDRRGFGRSQCFDESRSDLNHRVPYDQDTRTYQRLSCQDRCRDFPGRSPAELFGVKWGTQVSHVQYHQSRPDRDRTCQERLCHRPNSVGPPPAVGIYIQAKSSNQFCPVHRSSYNWWKSSWTWWKVVWKSIHKDFRKNLDTDDPYWVLAWTPVVGP